MVAKMEALDEVERSKKRYAFIVRVIDVLYVNNRSLPDRVPICSYIDNAAENHFNLVNNVED